MRLSRFVLPLAAGCLLAASSLAQSTPASPQSASQTSGDAPGLIEQGNQAWSAGDVDAAIVRYREAAEQDPNSFDARMKLGGAYLDKHDFEAGIRAFQAAAKIQPDNADAYIAMGIAYLHSGGSGLAHAAFMQAVELDPTRFDTLEPVIDELEAKQSHFNPHGPAGLFDGLDAPR
jgi:Flp pilus assembly protein TadD